MRPPVILAEKPSQAKAYADAFSIKTKNRHYIELNACSTFPSGAIITWAIGHLVELRQPEDYKTEWKQWNLPNLPILPSKYEFKVTPNKEEQFAQIKELFNSPEYPVIINGADVDREGSNIFYSIYNMTGAKNKVIKRLWINSLEPEEIRKGFNNLRDNKKDLLLYEEAKARQISDWLVGMNGSRLYTILLQKKGYKGEDGKGVISIGRVQTPTVYLIYQRQQEIQNFISTPFYEIEGNFTAKNGKYKGKAKAKSDNKAEIQAIIDKHQINATSNGLVQSVTKKEKRAKSPKLHALSTLQATANKKWKYSPADVLKLVQVLYEMKLVSYPRTDTQVITDSEFAYLLDKVNDYQKLVGVSFPIASKTPNKRYVDGKKVQEHYAIIPTKNIPSNTVLAGLTKEQSNIYYEIVKTTLAMFHADYIYEETKIITDVNKLEFETTGNTEKSKGWKELFANESSAKKDDNQQVLPVLQQGETVAADVNLKESMTTPPKPYTEGQLIGMMKTCGKSVDNEEDMEILKEVEGLGTEATRSGIIETIKRHKYIEVTKNIVHVTKKGELLCKSIEGSLLSSPMMTAKWEGYLRKIGEGQGTGDVFLKNIEKFIEKLMIDVPKQVDSAAVINHISANATSSSSAAKGSSKSGKGSNSEKVSLGKCPKCGNPVIEGKSYFLCQAYKNPCDFIIGKTSYKATITKTDVKALLAGKMTKEKTLTYQSGKTGNSCLGLDANKRVVPSFALNK